MIQIQPIAAPLLPQALALNNAHAVELSWLDPDRLAVLHAQAFHAARIGELEAFLLAFDHTAQYDSPNCQLFRMRLDRFIYIDRVVVAPAVRGLGYARLLYADLFRHAWQSGHRLVVCEVNRNPPNPASDAFHARQGFSELGQAAIPGGSKTVRYLCRNLAAEDAT